jgi:hypothetical protein
MGKEHEMSFAHDLDTGDRGYAECVFHLTQNYNPESLALLTDTHTKPEPSAEGR